MNSNTKAAFYSQPSPGYLVISGPDQLDCLQRQTTNDINLLSPGHVLPTVLTSPTARILDVFYLFSESGSEARENAREGKIGILTTAGSGDRIYQYLESRIFFMDKVRLTTLSQDFCQIDLFLDETPAEGWAEERLPGGHWSRGVLFPRLFQDADLLVQTCCLKTHRYGGHFTLSLKNSVGMVAKYGPRDNYNYMSELHGSSHQRQMIAEINQLYRPAMIVLDGLEGFADGGPGGTLVKPQVMLLGADRVAVDAVGVAILRMHGGNGTISRGRVFDQEQIARAVRLGLGAAGPKQIDLVTDDPDSRKMADRVREVLSKG